MGYGMLMRMATSAQLVDISLEQQRLIAAMRIVTGVTVEILSVGLIATFLTAFCTSRVMAGQTKGLDPRL